MNEWVEQTASLLYACMLIYEPNCNYAKATSPLNTEECRRCYTSLNIIDCLVCIDTTGLSKLLFVLRKLEKQFFIL